MDDLKYVVAMLQGCNYAAVARSTGLNRRTVWAIATGRNTTPTYHTVRLLADYFKGKA